MTLELTASPQAAERHLLLEALYEKAFPVTARFIRQMGGEYDEAKDLFQDALVIYYEKIVLNRADIQVSPEAYIAGIVKHLWIKKYKQDQRKVRMSTLEWSIDLEDTTPAISMTRLLDLVTRSGRRCLELLNAFYYDKLPMKRIRELFGYGSERSATVQKYKCIEKIRNEVKTSKLTYEDFLE